MLRVRLLLAAAPVLLCLAGPSLGAAALVAQSAPVSMQVTLDRARATVGEPIGVTVVVRYAAGAIVTTDGIADQLAPFEILTADPPVEQVVANNTSERRLHYRVAAYATGPIQFPALTIPYQRGGQADIAKSQAMTLTIESVIPAGDQAADIRPLKPQIELRLPVAPSLRRAEGAAAALVLLIIVGAVVWLRFRHRQATELLALPAESLFEAEARAELDSIVADDLLARGEYSAHYARLAECIRRYVTQRYGFRASAMTTTELGYRMVRSGVGRWRARLVAGLLAECDAVHYAHYLPAPARAEADLRMAFEILDLALSQETRPEDNRREVGG